MIHGHKTFEQDYRIQTHKSINQIIGFDVEQKFCTLSTELSVMTDSPDNVLFNFLLLASFLILKQTFLWMTQLYSKQK